MNSHNGIGIRIIRSDNSFSLITVMELAVTNKNGNDAVFTGDYDADGNVVRVSGFSWQELTVDFEDLINEFFTTQI